MLRTKTLHLRKAIKMCTLGEEVHRQAGDFIKNEGAAFEQTPATPAASEENFVRSSRCHENAHSNRRKQKECNCFQGRYVKPLEAFAANAKKRIMQR